MARTQLPVMTTLRPQDKAGSNPRHNYVSAAHLRHLQYSRTSQLVCDICVSGRGDGGERKPAAATLQITLPSSEKNADYSKDSLEVSKSLSGSLTRRR